MSSITFYNLPKVVNFTYDGNFGLTNMNYPVNRTDFTISKGITNEIFLFVRDIDRKPVAITQDANAAVVVGTINAVITNETRTDVVLNKSLTDVDPAKGIYMLTIDPEEIVEWDIGAYVYSLVVERDDQTKVTLYSDRDYGPYSTLFLTQGPYPAQQEPIEITFDDFTAQSGIFYTGSYKGSATIGHYGGDHVAVATFDDFTGHFTIQGSLENQPSTSESDWFVISHNEYTHKTGPENINFTANLMWVRFVLVKNDGELTRIQFIN